MDYLTKLKEDRIQAQYHLKDIVLEDDSAVKEFILECKTVLEALDSEKIDKIRRGLRKFAAQ